MLAIWLEDQRLDLRDDLLLPEPPAGEALIRVQRAGICNTDVELVRGYYPYDASALVVDEITLVGSRCGPFAPALELLRTSQIEVEPLTSARFPLADGLAAFEKAQQPGVLKVLLDV